MSNLPKRDAYSRWKNPELFTDIHTVLQLLNSKSPTRTPTHLHECHKGSDFEWEIIVPWYTQGDSGGDQSGYDYFQIEKSLAERLVTEGLVHPRTQVGRGYTTSIKDELVISTLGKEMIEGFQKDMRAKAESMLTPGVHTDLTGKPMYLGSSREHWRYGPLYYEFEMPSGGSCRVYPEEGRIVLPKESETMDA